MARKKAKKNDNNKQSNIINKKLHKFVSRQDGSSHVDR